jgi:hypothetical protein
MDAVTAEKAGLSVRHSQDIKACRRVGIYKGSVELACPAPLFKWRGDANKPPFQTRAATRPLSTSHRADAVYPASVPSLLP